MTRRRPSTRLRSARLSRLDACVQYMARDALAGLKITGEAFTSTTMLSEPGAAQGVRVTLTIEIADATPAT